MKQANAAQKKWMSDIAGWAQENIGTLYGDEWSGTQFQLHHVLGRSAKHDKVAIGHEFILPVPFDLHDVSSNHSLNVTHSKKAFVNKFGNQRDLFNSMVYAMATMGYTMPPDDVYHAIMSTSA